MEIDVVELKLERKYKIVIDTKYDRVYGVETAGPIFCKEIGSCNVEVVAVLCLDNTNKIINFSKCNIGSINYSKVDVSQIIKVALLSNATMIIVGHNHPSGVLEFTDFDISMTKKIGYLAKQLKIKLVDSLIVNEKYAISAREIVERLDDEKRCNI